MSDAPPDDRAPDDPAPDDPAPDARAPERYDGPSTAAEPGGLDRLLRSRARAAGVVVVALLLAVACALVGRGIRVDTDLEALLAPTDRAVLALEELRSRQGSTDDLYVAVKSRDPQANHRLVLDIARELASWPDAHEVVVDRDFTPFRDQALYYLEVEELAELRDELRRQRQLAVARTMGTGVGGGAPDLREVLADDDWDAPLHDEENPAPGAPSPPNTPPEGGAEPSPATDPSKLRRVLDDHRAALLRSGRLPAADLDAVWPPEDAEGRIPWEPRVARPFASADGRIHLVRARLTRPATDVAYARGVAARVDAILQRLDPASYAPDMLAKIGGPYMASREANAILLDLRHATLLSGALVAGILFVGFRTIRALAVVLLPILVASAATLALARVLFGELNILTAFLFAVLFGIGVDYAVYLYALREDAGRQARWGVILRAHLRPLGASMATTVGSFLILLLADFSGFREFGAIAALGVVVSFLVTVVLVPALDVALGGTPGVHARGHGGAPALPGSAVQGVRVAVLLLTCGLAAWGIPRLEFERDLRRVRAPESAAEKGIAYTRALNRSSGTPIVVLADDAAQLDAAVERLRGDRETVLSPERGRPWIREVASLALAIPADAAEKAPLLAEIHELAKSCSAAIPPGNAEHPLAPYRSHLDALVRLSAATPLTPAQVPAWARTPFEERSGHADRLALVYTDLQAWDLEEVRRVRHRFDELTGDLAVRGASSRFVLADLSEQVEIDARRLPLWAFACIAVLVLLDQRRVVGVVACTGALALGVAATLGAFGLWPIRINFYNLVVMPAVIGLGIDASIHLWHARSLAPARLRATSKAALLSALTTAGGFGGLVAAEHLGLRSIGQVGVTAVLVTVLVALGLLGLRRR